MIVIEKMQWSNCFSYGKDNEIDFLANPITQLVGANGNGKSSIPLILELGLFNKNSKGIKTADIINRYIDENWYTIKIWFRKDEDSYFIDTKRASTQTVKLYQNGIDISAHTATNTFKSIESILGFDHKSFCQLVYQSSAQSLEFLTATDTNRKKFLIDLLNLGKYTEAYDIFKAATKEVQLEVAKVDSSITTISSWLSKNQEADLEEKVIEAIPPAPMLLQKEQTLIASELSNIEALNLVIKANNKAKADRDSIDLTKSSAIFEIEEDGEYVKELAEHSANLKNATAFLVKVKLLKSVCPTCSHPIDNSKQLELVDSQEEIKSVSTEASKTLALKISEIKARNKILTDNEDKKRRWEQYNSKINSELSEEILDKNDLEAKVTSLETQIEKQLKEIAAITKANQLALVHNTKVELISSQLVTMGTDLATAQAELKKVTSRLTTLNVLSKAFSPHGLVAFKIENMIKDLEDLVNEYLAELSYGRFQISFVISGEKLNVVISDNGRDVEMLALSSGEKARVNTATLLAIRKLMQHLSNNRINLLILDETIDNLDVEGKEKLVEILVKEEHLNTFLISHGYNHPLLEKISIIKLDNISRIEV